MDPTPPDKVSKSHTAADQAANELNLYGRFANTRKSTSQLRPHFTGLSLCTWYIYSTIFLAWLFDSVLFYQIYQFNSDLMQSIIIPLYGESLHSRFDYRPPTAFIIHEPSTVDATTRTWVFHFYWRSSVVLKILWSTCSSVSRKSSMMADTWSRTEVTHRSASSSCLRVVVWPSAPSRDVSSPPAPTPTVFTCTIHKY